MADDLIDVSPEWAKRAYVDEAKYKGYQIAAPRLKKNASWRPTCSPIRSIFRRIGYSGCFRAL